MSSSRASAEGTRVRVLTALQSLLGVGYWILALRFINGSQRFDHQMSWPFKLTIVASPPALGWAYSCVALALGSWIVALGLAVHERRTMWLVLVVSAPVLALGMLAFVSMAFYLMLGVAVAVVLAPFVALQFATFELARSFDPRKHAAA